MLQEVEKCEVKPHSVEIQESNVKSILAKFESQKLHFLQFKRLWTLKFGKFGIWKLLKCIENQNSVI